MADGDFIRELGRPFLAHRLKRLSEAIVTSSGKYLEAQGQPVAPKGSSTLLLLRQTGPLAITEIAAQLKLSHPMIVKLTGALAKFGLVEDEMDPADSRRRLVRLTPAGVEQADRIVEIARLTDLVFAEIARETGVDLLDAVERFEEALRKRPLDERMKARAALAVKS